MYFLLPEPLADLGLPTTIDSVEEKQQKTVHSGRWWQYGYHVKGPKSKGFKIDIPSAENPYHNLHFQDPASERSKYPEVMQSGRLRLGEGNDITPNPPLLRQLGESMKRLTQAIGKLSSSSQRKQKMMLSSRYAILKYTYIFRNQLSNLAVNP